MKTALIKLAKLILTHSEKARSGVVIAVLSVVAGFLGLMLLPVAVLSGMGGIDPPETKFKFVESDFMSSLDPNKQDKVQVCLWKNACGSERKNVPAIYHA